MAAGMILSVKQSLAFDAGSQLASVLLSDAFAPARAAFRNYACVDRARAIEALVAQGRGLRADVRRFGREGEAEGLDSEEARTRAVAWERRLRNGVQLAVLSGLLSERDARILRTDAAFATASDAADGLLDLLRTLSDQRSDLAALSLPPDFVAEGDALLLRLYRERGEGAVVKVERELAARALRPVLEALRAELELYVAARAVAEDNTTLPVPRFDLDVVRSALADAEADIAGAPRPSEPGPAAVEAPGDGGANGLT